jgi:hypothetical protein
LLSAEPNEIGRTKDKQSCDKSRAFQEFGSHIQYDTLPTILLADFQKRRSEEKL